MSNNNIGPFIINLDDTKLSSNEKNLIKHDLIGGIILFSHNFVSKTQLQSLVSDIKAVKENLLITIDHEGGRVQRILDGFTHLPSFESISQLKSTDEKISASYNAGMIGATELSEVNIDINYSPVIDINHHKNNKLLKDRTFGNQTDEIILLADSFIKGCLDGGILPVLKHFPGHGRVITDSHIQNCISDVDLNMLTSTDILPFQELHKRFIKYNLPIMTNHVIYKQVDKFITSYSKVWLQKLSNSIFSIPPIYISDDIEMYSATSALNKNISCEERVMLCLNAGCRMIIATTMQNTKIIDNNESYKYFKENYLTKNIIEYYEKNHDNMNNIILPKK